MRRLKLWFWGWGVGMGDDTNPRWPIYIPELVGVGLRQTSVSPELHIVISGSSVVFLKGRVEALSGVVRATVVSPHQPLCMTGWSQGGELGTCGQGGDGNDRMLFPHVAWNRWSVSGLGWSSSAQMIFLFIASGIRRNVLGGGAWLRCLDSGLTGENLLCAISGHWRVGWATLGTGLV